MRSLNIVVIAVFISVLVIGVGATPALAITGQSAGYVQYSIIIKGLDDSTLPAAATVNESVSPTDPTGFVDIVLSLSSVTTNFTYSKVVNS
ncbi:hypothetical protein E4G67_01400, partial [Candidatus Bathyarchaeota archaeon]